jgi:hypothetical protein
MSNQQCSMCINNLINGQQNNHKKTNIVHKQNKQSNAKVQVEAYCEIVHFMNNEDEFPLLVMVIEFISTNFCLKPGTRDIMSICI